MNIYKTIRFTLIALFTFTGQLFAQDLSFKMEITTAKSKEPIVLKVATNDSKTAIQPLSFGSKQEGMKDKGYMRILMDNASHKQYILMDNNGTKSAISVDPFNVEAASEKASEPKITVTKETKVINGYTCTKVIAETKDVVSDMWMTQEKGLTYNELFRIFNSTKGSPGARAALPVIKDIKGFPVQIVSKMKSGNETATISIKNISREKVDPAFFSMDGYKLVEMTKTGH